LICKSVLTKPINSTITKIDRLSMVGNINTDVKSQVTNVKVDVVNKVDNYAKSLSDMVNRISHRNDISQELKNELQNIVSQDQISDLKQELSNSLSKLNSLRQDYDEIDKNYNLEKEKAEKEKSLREDYERKYNEFNSERIHPDMIGNFTSIDHRHGVKINITNDNITFYWKNGGQSNYMYEIIASYSFIVKHSYGESQFTLNNNREYVTEINYKGGTRHLFKKF